MEKLAIGLTLISLLYVVLMFGWAYCLEYWHVHREKFRRWMSMRKKIYPVFKGIRHQLVKDNSRKAA